MGRLEVSHWANFFRLAPSLPGFGRFKLCGHTTHESSMEAEALSLVNARCAVGLFSHENFRWAFDLCTEPVLFWSFWPFVNPWAHSQATPVVMSAIWTDIFSAMVIKEGVLCPWNPNSILVRPPICLLALRWP